jgi:DNA-binding NtrC family response regulator
VKVSFHAALVFVCRVQRPFNVTLWRILSYPDSWNVAQRLHPGRSLTLFEFPEIWRSDMRPLVLVGSSSQARANDFQVALEEYGMQVVVVSQNEDYFQKLACHPWGVLLLECSIVWSDLKIESSESPNEVNWREIPLVLFASTGRLTRPVDEVRMPIHEFFQQFPSRDELMSAINSAWKSADPFVVEESNLEHQSCHL